MAETLMKVIVDVAAGEVVERECTPEEVAETQNTASIQEQADYEAEQIAREQARISGLAKLMSLGLTEAEANALLGI